MDKLMIVNCAADTSMHEGVPKRFADSEVLAASVEAAHRAGACVAHIHAPPTNFGAWESHSKAIRDRCGVMLQYGISTQTLDQRKEVVKNKPEMISIAVGAHNMAFIERDVLMLHPREEIADMMRLCNDYGVKPEFEVFSIGELWMINDLLDKGLLKPPVLMTIFFGRPGGAWSPATMEEFIHRVHALPDNSYYITSATGPAHLTMETMAVMQGGHVRVGTEDEPYLYPGVLGDNPDHVARIARVAKEMGREIASVDEARETLQIPKQ
jgi:3-keto-5-aminohexanoate cleavage enzyme